MIDQVMTRSVFIITALITIIITAALTLIASQGGGFASASGEAANRDFGVPITIHLVTALSAALLGPFILFRKKGDALHKAMGRIWAGLMLVTAITTIFIRAPGAGIAGSGFSFIHLFTVWTLGALPVAIWGARSNNIRLHRGGMIGLYIGLLIAGGFTLIPGRLLGGWVFGW
jgi:uncharacterized membrane protein